MGGLLVSALDDIREEIATDLAGIATVYPNVPSKFVPPIAIVVKQDPYITPAVPGERTFTQPWDVNVAIMFILKYGELSDQDIQADTLVEQTLTALKDYPVTEVSPLVVIELDEQEYTGFVVRITHNTSL
jgi:hypothetical protein